MIGTLPPTILNMRNCSWHGTRISPYSRLPHPYKPGEEITFEIEYHHVREQYFVKELFTKHVIVKYRNGTQRTRVETWGGWVYFGDTVKECIEWVKSTYGITINLLNSPVNVAHPDEEMELKLSMEVI